MNRRHFLKKGTTAAILAAIGFPLLSSINAKTTSSSTPQTGSDNETIMKDAPTKMPTKTKEALSLEDDKRIALAEKQKPNTQDLSTTTIKSIKL